MGNLFHIGEVAALMFLAYMLGWTAGYFARRLTARARPVDTVLAAARLAAARRDAEPTVAPSAGTTSAATTVAPKVEPAVVAPVVASIAPPPVAPSPAAEAQAIVEGLRAAPPPAQAANPVPSRPRPEPLAPPMPDTATPADESDEFVLLRPSAPGPVAFTSAVPMEAGPATLAGVAWSGDINGHPAPTHVSLLAGRPAEPKRAVARAPIVAPSVPPRAPAPPPSPPPAPFVAEPAVVVPVAPEPLPQAAVDRAPVVASAPAGEPKPSEPTSPPIVSRALEPVPPPAAAVMEEPEPELPPVVFAGRQPARAVVDPDALFSQMTSDDASASLPPPEETREAEEEVAPPLAEIIARQAAQLAAMAAEAEAARQPPMPDPPADSASEDDAMRAIEGGWSRRRVRAMTDRPELIDVSNAVAAAQSAVQKVLAQTEIDATPREHQDHAAGKPKGLPRPHDGRRDNLREILGLSPLDESTLNNLGIYHFEQVAAWTGLEVRWLEDHVFVEGRIGRETWQAQARELSRRRPTPTRLRG